jgi:hypothetical protein
MNIYEYSDDDLLKAERVQFKALAGYTITQANAVQAEHYTTATLTTIAGVGITRIDTGLTLDEAHAALTDGLTKAELVALGDDLGLILSDSSLKAELLAEIRDHLEGLA